MKLSWLSNAPWGPTGYGDQTRLIVPRLKDAGHNPVIIAFWGLEGGVLQWGNIPVLPKGIMGYGQDIAPAHTKNFGAKYLFSLVDAWVFNNSPFFDSLQREQIRWIPYFPIDTEPISQPVRAAVERAYRRIVYSRFGARMMEQFGLEYTYIPHGVDMDVLKPLNKDESFDALSSAGIVNLPKDAFIVGMVAANKGNPSRKAFTQQITAFANFKKKHPDAILYLHTNTSEFGEYNGINLPEFCRFIGLEVGKDVYFPDKYGYYLGFPKNYIANLYNIMDVHLLASCGEGFGIPIIEAQACGTPVIVGDWTAMSELCINGWLIDKTDAEPQYQVVGTNQFIPHISAVEDALEKSYNERRTGRNHISRDASDYDINKVVSKYWLPFLAKLEEEDGEAEKEMQAVRQMAGKRVTA